MSWIWRWCTVRVLYPVPVLFAFFYRKWWLNFAFFKTVMLFLFVSYRDLAEKQRMYSVSHGLNSGCVTFFALTRSADLALRRSALWVCIWRSTSRLVLARRADSWIYQGMKKKNTHKLQSHSPTLSGSGRAGKLTSWVEAAGQTLCVFLPAMFASFSPEAYRAKGCLLCLLSSLRCCADAALTLQERFDDLEGLRCLDWPAFFSTMRKDKILKYQQK